MNYSRIYNELVIKCKNRDQLVGIYYEKHHIIPKCMSGKDDADNLVYMTAKEHFISHLLLHKIYPNNPYLMNAVLMMKVESTKFHDRKLNSRMFDFIKNKLYNSDIEIPWKCKGHSDESKKKMSAIRKQYLQDHPEEKERMRLMALNRTPEHKEKIRQGSLGKKRTDEQRKNISEAHKGVQAGGKNPNARRVSVFGKEFPSVSEAYEYFKEDLNITKAGLYSRVNSDKIKECFYVD